MSKHKYIEDKISKCRELVKDIDEDIKVVNAIMKRANNNAVTLKALQEEVLKDIKKERELEMTLSLFKNKEEFKNDRPL